MFPTWEVELVRSTYSSSKCPPSTRAIRHSSPSETLINISFGTVLLVLCHFVLGHSFTRLKGPLVPAAVTSEHSHVAGSTSGDRDHRGQRTNDKGRMSLESLWVNLPRFLTQKVHDLSLAVEAHHPAGNLSGMFDRGRANDLLNLRHVRAVHAENVQPKAQ